MTSSRNASLVIAFILVSSSVGLSQGLPTGSIAGSVTSGHDGDELAGVRVTVRSPAQQGSRQTNSAANGEFLFVNLPPGDYTVELQHEGFQPVTRSGIRVSTSQRQEISVVMSLGAFSDEVIVTASTELVSAQPQSATTLTSATLDRLPIPRTIESAVLLAPGVEARPAAAYTSPATNAFSILGSETYENTITVDGVSSQENYCRQFDPVYVEDAVAEVSTMTSGISAEYGRFTGGVVNVVTRTGGNLFSGSFRTTLVNDAWTASTPIGEERDHDVTPIYEATLGGPIWRDRVWLFGSGRFFEQTTTSMTATPTGVSFPTDGQEERFQLKLTASPFQSQTITVGYSLYDRTYDDTYFEPFPILELASTYNDTREEHLLLVNYNGTLSNNTFLEANFGQRRLTHVAGSVTTDLLSGTVITAPAPFRIYNAAVFCAECPSPEDIRESDQGMVKATIFASTRSLGSHSVVTGLEAYRGSAWLNNYQSGSGYFVDGIDVIFEDGDLYPVFGAGSVLWYLPIRVPAAPPDTRMYSAYVNDTWDLNDRLTFNLGLRWDRNDARDPAGESLSSDTNASPRIAVTWDPTGQGKLRFTASYGRYVSAISENQISWATAWGMPAQFLYFYEGPGINSDPAQPLVSRQEALSQLFQWFGITAPGQSPHEGIDPFYVNYPGVSLQIRGDVQSPRADEVSVGVNGSVGREGTFRVDGVYRQYGDFYTTQLDTTTGTAQDPAGSEFDLGILRNTNAPYERHHMALRTTVQLRTSNAFFVGGSWTWAHTWGNQISEWLNVGAYPPMDLTYPEYWRLSWHLPSGDLPQDIRHRIRLWAIWDMTFVPSWMGSLSLSPLFSLDSGLPYGASGQVLVGDYVVNPGYLTPPAYVTYWFTDRDEYRTPTVTQLDLALNWSLQVGDLELFIQPHVLNVFNNQAIAQNDPALIDLGVRTSVNTPDLQPFNPFISRPVEGVNFAVNPTFGHALSPAAYQQPRTFRISMGVRF